MVVQSWYSTQDLDSSDERTQHYFSLKNLHRSSVISAKSSKVLWIIQNSYNEAKTVWGIVNYIRVKNEISPNLPQIIRDDTCNTGSGPKLVYNMFNDFYVNIKTLLIQIYLKFHFWKNYLFSSHLFLKLRFRAMEFCYHFISEI